MLNGNLVKTITSDGLELDGFWSDNLSKTAILYFHGTAGNFYTHKFIEVEAESLAKRGISFLSANNRGHDVFSDIRVHKGGKVGWTQIGGALEKFEDSFYDVDAWIKFLQKQGVKKIILQGHSLGPNKLIYYQAKVQNPKIIGFIHLSPQNDAGLMKSKLGDKKYMEVNEMIKNKLRDGKSNEMLPKELEEVCPISVLAYSGYFTEDGVGTFFPYHNPESVKWKTLGQVTQPQLLIFGESDPYIKPSMKEAIRVFSSKVSPKSDFTAYMIKDSGHSFVGYEKELVKIISNWLNKLV